MGSPRHSWLAAVAALLAAGVLLAACGSPPPAGTATASVTAATPTSQPESVGPSPTAAPSSSARPSTSPHPVVPIGGAYVTRVPVPHGCLTVGPAITGVKVYLVQLALHLVGHKERYDAATTVAVRAFQSAHALPVTGLVDSATWVALGTGYPFCVDRYTQQPVVAADASAATRIEAMIAYATRRVGVRYLWGGAGPIGFDCSGLAIEAMYAGGRVVRGLDTDLHIQAEFRTTNFIYASGLAHVPFAQRRRGDLVFFGSTLSHMAIYLGNGSIVEAVPPAIRIASTYADHLSVQPYVIRPFPS
jgi:cell wall-associated NlpC family hydrolase